MQPIRHLHHDGGVDDDAVDDAVDYHDAVDDDAVDDDAVDHDAVDGAGGDDRDDASDDMYGAISV